MPLPQPQLDAQIDGALDVNEALRHIALTILCGIYDTYFTPTQSTWHNLRIFTPADGGPAHFLPWDLDLFPFYYSSSSSIYIDSSVNLSRLLNNPANRRLYLGHVNDLCKTVFTSSYMTPWLAHYGSVVGQNYTGGASYIQSRRAFALSQLPAVQPFAITSNRGSDFMTNSEMASITGTGWLDISRITLTGNNGVSLLSAITWTTITNWQAAIPLVLGTNLLTFSAYDRAGNLLASKSIVVTTTASGGGADTDGDGINNWKEWIAGIDPTNSSSVLKMFSPSNNAPGLKVSWQSVSGKTYFLQRGTNLLQPGLAALQSNITGQAATTIYTDTTATNRGPYFYRVGIQ